MKSRDFARILRLKHMEGSKIFDSSSSDAYMRAYALGICDAVNDLLKSIGYTPEDSIFENDFREQRAREISKIMEKFHRPAK